MEEILPQCNVQMMIYTRELVEFLQKNFWSDKVHQILWSNSYQRFHQLQSEDNQLKNTIKYMLSLISISTGNFNCVKYNLIVRVMVFNATLNNTSAISWQSVLSVEETGVPGENHRTAASHGQIYHIPLYRVHLTMCRN